jgi:hypothetical protein
MILALVFQAKGREFPARQKACQAGLPAKFVRRACPLRLSGGESRLPLKKVFRNERFFAFKTS